MLHDELALVDRDGEPFEGRLSMSLVAGSGGVHDVIVRIEDVTERNRLQRELKDLADIDPLTGLFNRRRFERELSTAEQVPAAAVSAHVSWPDRIRRALDDDRLMLYAQPILDIASRTVTSYELLLRMQGADGEVILPGAFLPIAERRGMIRSIDRWVVGEAISLLEQRRDDAQDVRLQLNISARSLCDEDFLEYVLTALDDSGVAPADLVFEVTETAAIASLDDASRFLTALAERGCGIALDDSGAGFASFRHLKHLPFHELKIDGQFIQNLTTTPEDLVLVETLVQLARGLGKRTTAPYIENAATLQLVRDVGIDLAQGYYIGRPAPAASRIACRPVSAQ